ncbi:MAG: STAS-like domain-containing protein [Sulfuriferula sp.]|nr:STAS-like domain-containing protein [Sulfuriferula sp.]
MTDLLHEYELIEVDFLNKSLTPSFADECIGRLASAIGLNEFRKRIKLNCKWLETANQVRGEFKS